MPLCLGYGITNAIVLMPLAVLPKNLASKTVAHTGLLSCLIYR